jgi:hypothetical protein
VDKIDKIARRTFNIEGRDTVSDHQRSVALLIAIQPPERPQSHHEREVRRPQGRVLQSS